MTYWQGTVIDTAVWSVHTAPVASVTQNDAALINLGTGSAHCGGWIVSNAAWNFADDLEINFEVFYPASIDYSATPGACVAFGALSGSRDQHYARCNTGILMVLRSVSNAGVIKYINGSGSWVTSTGNPIPADTYCAIKITLIDGVISVYHDAILMYSWTITSDIITACGGSFQIEFGAGTYNREGTVIFRNLTLSSDIPGRVTVEYYTALRIASVAEAFQGLQVVPSVYVEAWRGFQVRRSLAAEKSYEIYVDVSARLEQAVQLSVISLAAFEQFRGLSVIGSVGTFEQFRELSVEARDLLIFEAYQSLAVLGQVDNNAFQQDIRLIIDGSTVEFVSFAEQVGAFFRQFDVQVNVDASIFPQNNVVFIRSLRRYAPAQLEFMTTLRLSSGSITVVNRVIHLMYDGVQDESRAPGQETATLRLVSPTVGLGWLKDRKGALPITRNWPKGTLASEVLQDIFAGSGLSYDLRIDDFPIGQLDVRGEFPNQIWPKIFTQELIYTDDDGETLIIAPRLPFPVQDIKDTAALRAALAAAPMNHDLDVSEYMIESTTVDRGGLIEYNAIRVANYQDADAVVQLAPPEIGEADSSGLTPVYGGPVPFRRVWLRGSHIPHDGYELRAFGVEETLELEETISFDSGLARTQRPIFGLLNVDWVGNVSLGTITPSEEGILTAEVSGKSVAVVRYSTRRYKFLYRDVEGDHKMSLWLTDEEAG